MLASRRKADHFLIQLNYIASSSQVRVYSLPAAAPPYDAARAPRTDSSGGNLQHPVYHDHFHLEVDPTRSVAPPTGRLRLGGGRRKQPLTPKSSLARLFEDEQERQADDASSALRLDPKLYPLSQAPWPGGVKRFKMALGDMAGTFQEDCSAATEEELGRFSLSNAGPVRSDKSKGKERAMTYGGADGLLDTTGASFHPPAQQLRSERGAHASRRRSRRSRPFGSLTGDRDGTGLDESEEDDWSPHRPARPSFERDSSVDTGPAGRSGTIGGGRLPSPGPPRKRPRAASHAYERSDSVDSDPPTGPASVFPLSRDSSMFAAGIAGATTAATLPSPNMSPPSPVPTFAGGEESQECRNEEDELPEAEGNTSEYIDSDDAIDLGSGNEISALLSVPDLVNTFDQLPPKLQSYLIFSLLKRSSIPVLQTINNIIAPSLRRDFLTDLPPELSVQILGYLDAKTLCRTAVVCKGWRRLVDGEWRVWKERLAVDGLWIGDGSEEREAREIAGGSKDNLFLRRWKAGVWDQNPATTWNGKREEDAIHIEGIERSRRHFSFPVTLASPSSSREASPFSPGVHFTHPFKKLYRRRFVTRQNWAEKEPTRVTFACHANNVVTCLQFDKDKVVSASDDHSINVFDTRTGAPKARLSGHEGGVWALQYIGNILVSGSTDRTVRVWDLEKGKCTHVFVGHTSTVRCLQIVEPENINPDLSGVPVWEPPYPLIVTGSRDWSLRVWKLPSPEWDTEYHPTVPMSPTEENTDPVDNPYHLRHLAGHRHAVRALAAHGRILVSGSYDCQVRVWDILTGECKHRLVGHSQKVYSVVYDHYRKQCASGSMDGTVRLWSTETGECKATLEGHSSLVGLLGLSFRSLVSAAADSTLRIWDPETGACRHTLAAHSGAITCFQHDEHKVISGSDGTLKMWDVGDGTFTRDLLTGLTGVWQVSFDQRFCVAAVQRNGQSEFEILDFGPIDQEDEMLPERLESSDPLIKAEEDEYAFPTNTDDQVYMEAMDTEVDELVAENDGEPGPTE
ncbi:F-box and WD-40 domain protein CDC4, partial [Phenoliferia sp. Uapishka_3]